MLIRDLGIKRVDIACKDPNPAAAGGARILTDSGIACTAGVMEEEGKALLEPFSRWQNGTFAFFKWAQRLDGTVDGGIISSYGSRTHVHDLRDKCDLLVIGGNTVRCDRPTLDARMVGGRAPDVLIYSRGGDFDPSIPLFSVSGRKVYIESTLERIRDYRLVMIEGGAGMMAACAPHCDWYLSYIAPRSGGGSVGMRSVTEEFEVLHATIPDDIRLWMKTIRKKPE